MTTKGCQTLCLALVCLLLLVSFSVHVQGEEEIVWRSFSKKKKKKGEKADKGEVTEKKAAPAKKEPEKPKPPPPKPKPKLTVGKESVVQEEFLFPEVATPKVPTSKSVQTTSTSKDEPAATSTSKPVTSAPADEPAQAEVDTERGDAPDIKVQDIDNPWIPNIIEDFVSKVREKQVLVAYQIDAPHLLPEIDGSSKEDAWLQSPVLEVPIERGPMIKIQAIYDDENIYFLLRWKDEQENRDKDLWHFNGEKWYREGEEDRMGIMWNIDNSILDFNVHACGISCHDTDKNKQLHKMYTNADVEFADLWDWGASTSDPLGVAEDGYLDNQRFERKSGQHDIISDFIGVALSVARGGFHYDDALKPGTIENTNEENTKPIYMIDPEKESDAQFLTEDNHKSIMDYEIFKKGDTIPGFLLRPLTGSRGDVQAKGKYKDGMWTLELKRKLRTENTDDVQFNPLQSYFFGIANFDNVRQEKHTKSAKCLLRFRLKQVYTPALFFGILSVSIIYLVSLKKHDWEEGFRLAKNMAETRLTITPKPVISRTSDQAESNNNSLDREITDPLRERSNE